MTTTTYDAPPARESGERARRGWAVAVLSLSGLYTVLMVLLVVPVVLIVRAQDLGAHVGDATRVLFWVCSGGLFALRVPLMFVTGMWLRAERRRLRAEGHTFWFGTVATFVVLALPLISLVLPFIAVAEVQRAAVGSLRRARLAAWWGTWVTAVVGERLASQTFGVHRGDTPADVAIGAVAAAALVLVLAYAQWARVVWTTHTRT